ncbi:MAG TPA: MarR family transcriptional regulator [Stellaceae bacterium]|jgi:DNA-binding MarR family transcriptional regulator|nr:MarR family transcriptional regulator [Stellaceae bacterium]
MSRKREADMPALPAAAIPPPGQGKRGREGYLSYLLRQAGAASRLSLERSLAGIGVTPPQFVALTMLDAYPGISGADLARLTFLTPQTIGVIVGNLEKADAIARQKHPTHGRALRWRLTAKGEKLLAGARTRAHALEGKMSALLPKGAEPAVRAWLAALATELTRLDE